MSKYRIESPKKHTSIIGEDGVNFLLEHMKKMVSESSKYISVHTQSIPS